jgi:hypothetical protein
MSSGREGHGRWPSLRHADRVGRNDRNASNAARGPENRPRATCHSGRWAAVELQDAVGNDAVAIRPADVHALALVLDQLFDGLNVVDDKWDCI